MVVLIVAGEITARCLGHRPWKETIHTITVSPEGRFYQDDSLLGYRGKPGTFELVLNDSARFTITHDADGWRTTGSDTTTGLPEIWLLGCSFTHGYGVSDGEDYAAQLQRKLPAYRIRNYGMDGYGTLHNWLLLKDLLGKGKKPFAVVLGYGAFHDQRNTANRYWHKALHGQRIADNLQYPFIRLDKNDSLQVQYGKIGYHPLPLQRYLAMVSLIEERWNHSEDQGLRSKYVTEVLIQRIADLSHGAGAHFVLAGVYRHPETGSMLTTFKLDRMHTVDISQDLDQTDLRILPGNGHPNAKAHSLMADALYQFLMAKIILPPQSPQP